MLLRIKKMIKRAVCPSIYDPLRTGAFKYCLLHNDNSSMLDPTKWNKRFFSTTEVAALHINEKNYKLFLNNLDRWLMRTLNGHNVELLDDKSMFAKVCADAGIPTTKIVGEIRDGKLYNTSNGIIDEPELDCMLEKGIFYKPDHGCGGSGTVKAFKDGELFWCNGESRPSIHSVYEFLAGQLNGTLEELMVQDGFFHQVFPHSLNTLRLITYRGGNHFELLLAAYRFGTTASGQCDNLSAGGIGGPINLASGEMGLAGSVAHIGDWIAVHPDTGVQIAGVTIEKWEDIKKTIIEYHSRIPYFKCISWDVVVINGVLTVVEGNGSSSIDIMQIGGKPQKHSPLGRMIKKEWRVRTRRHLFSFRGWDR